MSAEYPERREKRVKERRGAQMVAMPDLEVFSMAEEYYLEVEK